MKDYPNTATTLRSWEAFLVTAEQTAAMRLFDAAVARGKINRGEFHIAAERAIAIAVADAGGRSEFLS